MELVNKLRVGIATVAAVSLAAITAPKVHASEGGNLVPEKAGVPLDAMLPARSFTNEVAVVVKSYQDFMAKNPELLEDSKTGSIGILAGFLLQGVSDPAKVQILPELVSDCIAKANGTDEVAELAKRTLNLAAQAGVLPRGKIATTTPARKP